MRINPKVHEILVRNMDRSSKEDADYVSACVARYATPHGCCDTLQHIIHHIVNAVKYTFSCFGCTTDWEHCKEIIFRGALISNLSDHNIKVQKNPKFIAVIEKLVEKMMPALVKIHEAGTDWTEDQVSCSDKQINEKVTEIAIEFGIIDIEKQAKNVQNEILATLRSDNPNEV